MRDFGKLVVIEGLNFSEDRPFSDLEILLWACEDMVLSIGMTPMMQPMSVKSKLPPPNDGYTIIQAMEQSCASIHAFPSQNYIRFVLDSCKNFNQRKLLERLTKFFKLEKSRIHDITTGFDHRNYNDT